MFLEYRDIIFDYNEGQVTERYIKTFFETLIDIATNVSISEIDVEDKDTAYIYIDKKGKANEWDKETLDFVEKLQKSGYSVLCSDEDYGENVDMIIVYENHLFKHKLLSDFERAVILKTLLYNINLVFLSKEDLEQIKTIAYEMEVEGFPKYDLNDLYNNDDNRINLVYKKYTDFIINEYLEIREEIIKILNG